MKHLPLAKLSDVQEVRPVYLIERDFGDLGTEIFGYREHDRKHVLGDVAGDWRNPVVKVLELNEAAGTVKDVTQAFAKDIRDDHYNSREPASYELRTWIEQQLGVMATKGLVEG